MVRRGIANPSTWVRSLLLTPKRENMTEILFIVKKGRLNYIDECAGESLKELKTSGLLNSAKYVMNMLREMGVSSDLELAIDNNCIDRLVTKHRPKTVIIEALWVVPEKFEILRKLHPHVHWIIRLHSEIPFLSMEGMAIDWIFKYSKQPKVFVAVNSKTILKELESLLCKKVLYLPNYYKVTEGEHLAEENDSIVNIGCFGAIRPYKNQLAQAMAAIRFAQIINKTLYFHINSTRIENNGSSILHNIRSLFKNTANTFLIEHAWMEHHHFKKLVSQMNYGMQVSFTETFNIVTADMVDCGVPVIVSEEIVWASFISKVKNPTSVDEIVNKLITIKELRIVGAQNLNKHNLKKYSEKSKLDWAEELHLQCG